MLSFLSPSMTDIWNKPERPRNGNKCKIWRVLRVETVFRSATTNREMLYVAAFGFVYYSFCRFRRGKDFDSTPSVCEASSKGRLFSWMIDRYIGMACLKSEENGLFKVRIEFDPLRASKGLLDLVITPTGYTIICLLLRCCGRGLVVARYFHCPITMFLAPIPKITY